MSIKKKIAVLLLVGVAIGARGQNIGIKTNLVGDAFLNVNLGVEAGLAPKWTLDVPVSYNAWILDDGARWKHLLVQPGVRYWFCDRFSGHFVGAHAHGGIYNVGGLDLKVNPNLISDKVFSQLKDSRFQGWLIGAGISYGYAWILGEHWNIEAEIGAGYAYTRYDQFNCTGCGKKTAENVPHHYVGPTKAAISLVYLF
ncbi:MAG: DUF3575 domain-containing protein [Bacteroidales bacterium]|nr:DUF3575 domain-containing protein [Bacteroidales bacterium]